MEKLFDGEYRLMEVLWESAPVNSTQLVTLCREQLGWTKSTTYAVLRKLCRKGAARNERAVVTPLLTREQVIRAQGEELAVKAGGMAPFLNAFFSGRKLTMEEALELAAGLLSQTPAAAERCRSCKAQLQQGEELSGAMRESGVLPPAACRLLALGVRGGTADTVMEEIARRLAREGNDALSRKVAQVEPALVLVTSLLVGAILLSVMLPLMNIMAAIG